MYTSHGHQIPGTPVEGPPRDKARCGGPGLCTTCSSEAINAITKELITTNQAAEELLSGQSPILKYFVLDHLPEKLRPISAPFHILAHHMEEILPAGPEKSVTLRKLLEAKDAAVRAALDS